MVTMLKPRLQVLQPTLKPPKGNAIRHVSRSRWQKLRDRIMLRDKGMCQPCKRSDKATAAAEVDHKVPIREGGSDDPANLEAICSACHQTKTAAEAGRWRP